jgi:transcriptional regulator with XRE-family HTH domain
MDSRLKARRLERGLTQDALAAASRVPQKHVSQLELGRIGSPSWPTVYRLARALKVKPEHLFPVEAP